MGGASLPRIRADNKVGIKVLDVMNCLSITFIFASLLASTLLAAQPQPSPQRTASQLFVISCAPCHGTRLQGNQGPSLLSPKLLHGSDDQDLARSIRDGYPAKGMPAWGDSLSGEDVQLLANFIKEQRVENSPEHLAELDAVQIRNIPSGVLKTELEKFRIQVIARLGKTFGLAFLPDGRLLVTEERGALRIVDHNRLLPAAVQNTPMGRPADTDVFKRVLLDVAVHPDYKHNGWIYLTCADHTQGPDGKSITIVKLVRGRLRNATWVDSQTLVSLPLNTDTGRIAFDDRGHVYLSTSSEAGVNESRGGVPCTEKQLLSTPPQDLNSPLGKILRFNDDGTVPADNPFVATPGAVAAIWSYGHRNPQGLAFNPDTGQLWSTEHGPRGGDELNLIRSGHNYGWPVISYGTRYDGMAFTAEVEHAGMEQPVINWTPSIAVSAITFYEGNAFPRWKHTLFICSLKQQELFRVVLDGQRVTLQESILKDIGRIRGIAVDPKSGALTLALELKTEGLIVRLVPSSIN
jgi:glucose/arabinose dehydrogenase